MLRLAYQQGRIGTRVPIMRCQNAIFRTRYATGQGPAPPAEPPERVSQGGNSKENDEDRDDTSSRSRRNEDKHCHGEPNRFRYSVGAQATVAAVILSLAGGATYSAWLDSQWEKKMLTAFNKSPAPVVPDFVECPSLNEMVNEVITRCGCTYEVIVGPHGSGKSTIIKRLACETSGVIYISIESGTDTEKGLSQAIIAALGGLPPALSLGAIWANLVGDANPDHHIGTALKLFQQAAARFKAEHNRPAVLVIDHIDIIAQQNPDLLAALQHVAEEAADKKLFKFVFVGSNRFSFEKPRCV